MACRCEDSPKLKVELGTLMDAYGKVTRMEQLESQIVEYLDSVSSVIDETLIVPQHGLPGSIKRVNTDADLALALLSTEMYAAQEKLLADIEAAEAEDAAFHG